MNKTHVLATACALVLISSQAALANAGEESLNWGDFLLRILNAAVFVGILWHVAGKLIRKFFKTGREAIVQERDELEARRQEAEKKLAEVEARIADAGAECDKLLADGKAQAERLKASILADAELEAARIVEQARCNAEQEGRTELETIRGRMADVIASEVEKALAERLDAEAHQKLIDKSLTKVVLQ